MQQQRHVVIAVEHVLSQSACLASLVVDTCHRPPPQIVNSDPVSPETEAVDTKPTLPHGQVQYELDNAITDLWCFPKKRSAQSGVDVDVVEPDGGDWNVDAVSLPSLLLLKMMDPASGVTSNYDGGGDDDDSLLKLCSLKKTVCHHGVLDVKGNGACGALNHWRLQMAAEDQGHRNEDGETVKMNACCLVRKG